MKFNALQNTKLYLPILSVHETFAEGCSKKYYYLRKIDRLDIQFNIRVYPGMVSSKGFKQDQGTLIEQSP